MKLYINVHVYLHKYILAFILGTRSNPVRTGTKTEVTDNTLSNKQVVTVTMESSQMVC